MAHITEDVENIYIYFEKHSDFKRFSKQFIGEVIEGNTITVNKRDQSHVEEAFEILERLKIKYTWDREPYLPEDIRREVYKHLPELTMISGLEDFMSRSEQKEVKTTLERSFYFENKKYHPSYPNAKKMVLLIDTGKDHGEDFRIFVELYVGRGLEIEISVDKDAQLYSIVEPILKNLGPNDNLKIYISGRMFMKYYEGYLFVYHRSKINTSLLFDFLLKNKVTPSTHIKAVNDRKLLGLGIEMYIVHEGKKVPPGIRKISAHLDADIGDIREDVEYFEFYRHAGVEDIEAYYKGSYGEEPDVENNFSLEDVQRDFFLNHDGISDIFPNLKSVLIPKYKIVIDPSFPKLEEIIRVSKYLDSLLVKEFEGLGNIFIDFLRRLPSSWKIDTMKRKEIEGQALIDEYEVHLRRHYAQIPSIKRHEILVNMHSEDLYKYRDLGFLV